MDSLTPLRAFRRIVELGSIARAADALDLSSAALSKQLRALEAQLGAVLIQRTTRRMSLTDTGRAYYAECCRLLDGFDTLEQSVRAQSLQVTGRLRVNAPLSFALSTLAQLLARFMQRHPQLQIDASFTDRLVDMADEGYDAAVRIGPLEDSRMIARALPPLRWVTVASPDYLAENGTPRSLEDLARHRCLCVYNHYYGRLVHWQFLDAKGAAQDWQPPQSVTFDSGDPLIEGSLAGLGVAQVMEFAVREHIQSGRLTRLLPEFEGRSRELSLVYPRARQASPKIKVLTQLLLAQDCW